MPLTQRERDDILAIRDIAVEARATVSSHEKLCAERQGEIRNQLRQITRFLLGVAGGVVVGVITTVANLILHFLYPH